MLLVLLWRHFAALRCVRSDEQHVFLRVVVVVVMGRLGAATICSRAQRIRRIVVIAVIWHLKSQFWHF